MQPQSAVHHGLPGIDARPIGSIVIRLQAFPGQQFSVGDQEIQFQPPLVGVLHPQNAVLVFIEPGHQNPLKAGHDLLPLPGRQFSLRERQYAGGVLFRIRRGIDKLPDFLRFSLQHGRPLALPVFSQQVIHRTGTTTASPGMKFNDHHPPPFSSTACRSRSSPASIAIRAATICTRS